MRRVVNVIKVVMVLAAMACIFYLSSQAATESRALSNRVAEQLKDYIETVTYLVPFIRKVNLTHPVVQIRKVAHFTIYLVLGLVSYLALPRQWSVKKKMTLIVSLCFIYAITDEFHQSFVPGRSPEVRDVLIDTLGSSVGMSIGYFIKRFK